MATKNTTIPQYGTTMRGNIQYYRTRILDADGKQVALYATSPRPQKILCNRRNLTV